ncbi:MAG: general secretion pathway protein D [Verrucomicrobiales bacterium]
MTLSIPLGAVAEILPLYEQLTGKVVIKDSSIYGGPEVSLVTPNEVTQAEAIRLIEAALIINGYVVIHDEESNTVKIMLARAANQPASNFNEGELLYTDAADLPLGEALIGYFMALDYMAPEDAATIMTNHVQLNPYGRITPVVSPPGLLVTESANLIRKLVKMKNIIDVAPDQARLMTEFVQLTYADSNTVAQIIQAAMDARYEESQRIAELGRTITGSQPQQNQPQRSQPQQNSNQRSGQTNNQNQGQALGTSSDPAPQLIADDRLNRIMVQASPNDFAFIINLIQEFDQPAPEEEPLERPLMHVKVSDILPAVVDILMDTGTGQTQLPGGRTLNTQQTPVASSQLTALTGLSDTSQQSRFVQNADAGTTDGQPADRLEFPIDDVAPVSVLVGKTRLIADRQANVLIVMGTDEAKKTVENLLEKLDRRPPQIYLAMVIGQLTLGDNLDLGVDYLQEFEAFNAANPNAAGLAASLIGNEDIITNGNISDIRDNLITNSFGPASGLNVYGALGERAGVFISALETTTRFKVLSRPVLAALNNKKASITSGQRIPVPSQTITDATGGAANATLNTTITFEDVVLKLEVIPMINADNEVTLEIAQVNDTVVGNQLVSGNNVPVIATEELTTTISVPDRHTIVLGGLITESDNKTINGVPLASRIPLLGNAFRKTERDVTRSELLIFIQPVVVNGKDQLIDASLDEDYRTQVGADAAETFPNAGMPTQNRDQEDFERSEKPNTLFPNKREKQNPEEKRLLFPFGKRK